MKPSVPLYQAKAELFRTLGHPVRIRVLELLQDGPRPVRELLGEIEVESSNLSQQLAVLAAGRTGDARPVTARAVLYTLATPDVAQLLLLRPAHPRVDVDRPGGPARGAPRIGAGGVSFPSGHPDRRDSPDVVVQAGSTVASADRLSPPWRRRPQAGSARRAGRGDCCAAAGPRIRSGLGSWSPGGTRNGRGGRHRRCRVRRIPPPGLGANRCHDGGAGSGGSPLRSLRCADGRHDGRASS